MSAVVAERSPLEAGLVARLLERPPTSAGSPVGVLTQEEKAAELQRLQARKAMDAAYEVELILGLAEDTPDTLDPSPDHPGAGRVRGRPRPNCPASRSSPPASWRWC